MQKKATNITKTLKELENGGMINLSAEGGEVTYHQNYVEPILSLPESVDSHSPQNIVSDISEIYTTELKGLETLVSFVEGEEEEY